MCRNSRVLVIFVTTGLIAGNSNDRSLTTLTDDEQPWKPRSHWFDSLRAASRPTTPPTRLISCPFWSIVYEHLRL